jgi:glycosyltransferase involved in cell wall biosynthesis
MAFLSVCIPTHEMGGLGHVFLKESFDKLTTQTYKDFDVVVSDHSKNDAIKELCEVYNNHFPVHYYRNTNYVGLSSPNINNAMTHATGTLIKILFLDDFLYSDTSLQDIVDNFDLEKDHWMVTGCEHSRDGKTFYRPFYPRYHKRIYLGNNTISSPSVLTIKNDGHLLFDNALIWLMDVEYYKRCFDTFGAPKILQKINVVNRTGEHQGVGGYKNKNKRATNALKWKEYITVLKQYEHGIKYWYYWSIGFIKHWLKNI